MIVGYEKQIKMDENSENEPVIEISSRKIVVDTQDLKMAYDWMNIISQKSRNHKGPVDLQDESEEFRRTRKSQPACTNGSDGISTAHRVPGRMTLTCRGKRNINQLTARTCHDKIELLIHLAQRSISFPNNINKISYLNGRS